jgi:single-stranded DNA-binding protein
LLQATPHPGAEHVAKSLAKGSRVVVVGRLQQRSWAAEDGSARSVVESWPMSWGQAFVGDGDDYQDNPQPLTSSPP